MWREQRAVWQINSPENEKHDVKQVMVAHFTHLLNKLGSYVIKNVSCNAFPDPVLTTSRELRFSAMRVVTTSRSFVSWRSQYARPLRNASFRDLNEQKVIYLISICTE